MTATSPSDALCISLQILNHLQDCAQATSRSWTAATCRWRAASFQFARSTICVVPAETPGLRRVFATLLDRMDRLNQAATELPEIVRNLRLRLETAVILGLAMRLARAARRRTIRWRAA